MVGEYARECSCHAQPNFGSAANTRYSSTKYATVAGMERIGIRELRQNASVWVARAQNGEAIEISNHGRLVARLVPVDDADADREALIAAGRLAEAAHRGQRFDSSELLDAAETMPSISDILQQQRDDR